MGRPATSRLWIALGRGIVFTIIAMAILLAILEYSGLTQVRGDLLAYAVEHDVLAVLLFGYAILLAMPFVPGVTLGFAIMMVFGPQTAPVVWLASVCGLTFAFSLGRIAPRRWVAPLVPEFVAQFPETEIRLRLSDRAVDLVHDGLDVAFFLGQLKDSDLKLRKIINCERVLCAAPAYLEKYGVPEVPQDLLDNGHI